MGGEGVNIFEALEIGEGRATLPGISPSKYASRSLEWCVYLGWGKVPPECDVSDADLRRNDWTPYGYVELGLTSKYLRELAEKAKGLGYSEAFLKEVYPTTKWVKKCPDSEIQREDVPRETETKKEVHTVFSIKNMEENWFSIHCDGNTKAMLPTKVTLEWKE